MPVLLAVYSRNWLLRLLIQRASEGDPIAILGLVVIAVLLAVLISRNGIRVRVRGLAHRDWRRVGAAPQDASRTD